MFEIQNLSKVIFLSKAVSLACTHSGALKSTREASFLEDKLFLIVYEKKTKNFYKAVRKTKCIFQQLYSSRSNSEHNRNCIKAVITQELLGNAGTISRAEISWEYRENSMPWYQ